MLTDAARDRGTDFESALASVELRNQFPNSYPLNAPAPPSEKVTRHPELHHWNCH